jgi:ABC-2 type transport system permease protein
MLCVVMLAAFIFGGLYLAHAPWIEREALSPLKEAVTYADIFQHYEDFTRGIIDTREVLFYVSGTVIALIFSILSVEAKLLHS